MSVGSPVRRRGSAVHTVGRLNSWKEIAAYLDTSVRTVQRWEQVEGLPVHRHEHASVATVYTYTAEVDAWFGSRAGTLPRHRDAAPEEQPRRTKRLIVLPFRLIQRDPKIEFLSFGLADAITNSLSGIDSLTVRSTLIAAKFVGEIDLRRVSRESAVDLVLMGTVLRSGRQLRITAQLVETGAGTAIWSQTSQGGLQDIFQLQDQVAAKVLDALALPRSAQGQRLLSRDVPATPAAYEYYLRANELAYDFDPAARDLYLRCVEEDPGYAPAWVHLGRCCRILAKFRGDAENFGKAEAALTRALELRPNLSLAHTQLAYLEADSNLADRAMVRLLSRANDRKNAPELFAGLVHVCRYCGLLDASVSAHERTRELDPTIRTSVCHTHFLLGDYQQALETSREVIGFIGPLALLRLGRTQEAIALARQAEGTSSPLPLVRSAFSSSRALAEGARAEAIELIERGLALLHRGPEELYQHARSLGYLSQHERALEVLQRAVDEGFFCYPALVRDPWLQPLRANPAFEAIRQQALERHQAAVRMFVEARGDRILARPPASRR